MLIVLAIVITFMTALSISNHKHQKEQERIMTEFYEKEREANNVRKKPLDDLPYVEVPLEFIPQSLLADDPDVQECVQQLIELSALKIVNLTGISNTDLKLTYGTANINRLSEYDECYTVYARTMQRLAELYHQNGYESNARLLLEKAVESHTDISATYALLADIYLHHEEYDKMRSLLKSTREINSLARRTSFDAVMERIPESERPSEKELDEDD